MKALVRKRQWLGLLLAVVALLMTSWGAAASDAGEDDALETPPPSAEVTIAKKTSQVVITTIGDRYGVDEKETVIVGPDGRVVDYPDLPVPCDAIVTYHSERGSDMADLIQITTLSAMANKEFSIERPE
jgi:hypothetical protein